MKCKNTFCIKFIGRVRISKLVINTIYSYKNTKLCYFSTVKAD